MCGIIGVAGGAADKTIIEKARDALTHRGPDDAGLFYDAQSGVCLGHRRLSIIDASRAGHQPMESADGRYVMVFNGEIYNYLEIKKELSGLYDFSTKTDTEALLAAYQLRGESCLSMLNGMFAFAVWDKKERTLFCARDRVGIKPFFYRADGNNFLFASEIKGLLALGIKPELNERALFDYLQYGLYDHTEETFFSGIASLPPGHFLTWRRGQASMTKYWDAADVTERSGAKEAELRAEFTHLLEDAIKLRFRSDVPVGMNLSSGLDSNSIYHYALKITGGKLHTFTKCLTSPEYNECELLDRVLTNEQKKYWHPSNVGPEDAMARMDKVNRSQDQPFGGVLTLAYDLMAASAQKAGVTVLLEGQGGDELLAGYSHYLNAAALSASGRDVPGALHPDVLAEDFIRKHRGNAPSFPAPFASALKNAQYRDFRYIKLPRVLRFNDHATMAYGRELRLPFLDYRMVEFCFSLPDECKIRGTRQKALLRDVMEGIVPRTLQEMRKKNAGAIQAEWFRDCYKELVYELLDSESFKARPFWNHKILRERVDGFYRGKSGNAFFIWQCLNLELWFREYLD